MSGLRRPVRLASTARRRSATKRRMNRAFFLAVLLTACGGSSSSSTAEPTPAQTEATGSESGAPATADRPTMTDAECTAAGGTVVGDIGDGAIHRPEYRCENGQAPIGTIPVGIEGSVCCGG